MGATEAGLTTRGRILRDGGPLPVVTLRARLARRKGPDTRRTVRGLPEPARGCGAAGPSSAGRPGGGHPQLEVARAGRRAQAGCGSGALDKSKVPRQQRTLSEAPAPPSECVSQSRGPSVGQTDSRKGFIRLLFRLSLCLCLSLSPGPLLARSVLAILLLSRAERVGFSCEAVVLVAFGGSFRSFFLLQSGGRRKRGRNVGSNSKTRWRASVSAQHCLGSFVVHFFPGISFRFFLYGPRGVVRGVRL